MKFSVPFKFYFSLRFAESPPPSPWKGARGGEWETTRTLRETGTRRVQEIQSRCRSGPASGYNQKSYSVSVVFGFLFVKREPPSLTL